MRKIFRRKKITKKLDEFGVVWCLGCPASDCKWLCKNKIWLICREKALTWNDFKVGNCKIVGFNDVMKAKSIEDLVNMHKSKRRFEENTRETIIIYRNGNQVVAKDKFTGKTATAKCHPDDDFDFKTGAKLALDRLFEKENPEFEPYLRYDFDHSSRIGKIGEPTNLKDSLDNPLFVGDVVRLFYKDGEERENKFVAKDNEKPNGFIMGILCDCKGGNDYSGNWFVVKIKSFSDVEHFEKHGGVIAILK